VHDHLFFSYFYALDGGSRKKTHQKKEGRITLSVEHCLITFPFAGEEEGGRKWPRKKVTKGEKEYTK